MSEQKLTAKFPTGELLSVIRAELTGKPDRVGHSCTALGITADGNTPVL